MKEKYVLVIGITPEDDNGGLATNKAKMIIEFFETKKEMTMQINNADEATYNHKIFLAAKIDKRYNYEFGPNLIKWTK